MSQRPRLEWLVDPSYALCWLRSPCSRRKKAKKHSGLARCIIQSTGETCHFTATWLSKLLDECDKRFTIGRVFMTQTRRFGTRVLQKTLLYYSIPYKPTFYPTVHHTRFSVILSNKVLPRPRPSSVLFSCQPVLP